jgi:hypothetical protein
MKLTTAGALLKGTIYAFVYGDTGVGKTRLALSLSPDGRGAGCAWVTSEPGETHSIAQVAPDAVVALMESGNPVEEAVKAVIKLRQDPNIKIITVDALSVMCGQLVNYLSEGEGEKALGFEGWQEVLATFRRLEIACNDTVKKHNKSVIFTAWEAEPIYEDTMGGQSLKDGGEGRPFLQGKAKKWMPGQCDIIARMTSKQVIVKDENGKAVKRWKGLLHLDRSGDWLCKSRWKLPSPYPADLGQLLRDVGVLKKKLQTGKIASPLKKSA